jgi:MFS family permease
MPVREALGRAATTTVRGTRTAAVNLTSGGRRLTRQTRRIRSGMAGGETGMRRLFDLHATSIAGDTLIAVGLAGTIFFAVPIGEARAKVALYLLVTMVPFALLAPLIGPLLDHVPHGRRYALAATMLGRAMLAWLLADHMNSIALYPAVFGVLVLSRAYGVARAASVPRLLPRRLGLSQANARGSVYGTVAGAVVLPLGVAAFWVGPQWPLRVASMIFLVGMVIALRLPARADADPSEAPPRLFQLLLLRWSRERARVLSSRLVIATLIGGLLHRALYGFLLIFLAFTIREPGQLPTNIAGWQLGEGASLGVISGSLVVGTFLAVAAGSRLRIHRPVPVQAGGLLVVATLAVITTLQFTLAMAALLCLTAAISSGLAKLAIDSSIQERVHERLRATAFAHSETLLMLAFVAGSALGLIPMPGRLGIGIAAGLVILAAARTVLVAYLLRRERLVGRPEAALRDIAAARPGLGGTS